MRRHLSVTELKIINLVACGLSNKEAAQILGRAPRTIKMHLTRIFVKLGIGSDGRNYRARLTLARNWHCELYQEGLKALGYL